MTIEEKRKRLVEEFQIIPDPFDRLGMVVEHGKSAPGLADDERCEENRVEGCISRLWLVSRFDGKTCSFRTDSDAAIVKGVAGLLSDFYSGESPETVLRTDPAVLAEAGITQHLTSNRRDGLSRLYQKMAEFAAGCCAREGRGGAQV